MANILIVEDEEVIHELIKRNLSLVGHICHSAFDGKEALECLADKRFDLMILDIMLPKEDGFSVMRQAKGQPTIFLTARDSLNDRMTGFSLGADDYIIKPFHIAVLESRIAAVLRRLPEDKQPVLVCGDISLNKDKMQGYLNGEPVTLTALEYRLLHILLENKGRTLPRNLILERLWDADGNFVNDNTLTVTMRRLRKKLNDTRHIVTIRGIGYRMEEIV